MLLVILLFAMFPEINSHRRNLGGWLSVEYPLSTSVKIYLDICEAVIKYNLKHSVLFTTMVSIRLVKLLPLAVEGNIDVL